MLRRTSFAGASMMLLFVAVWGAAANSPPRAGVLSVEVTAGVPTPLVLPATDPDGDDLTFAVVGGPHHGTLEGAPPMLTYTPHPGFLGEDEITFRVADPYGAIDLGLVRLRVTFRSTTVRLGERGSTDAPPGGLSVLATSLADLGVAVWYIVADRAVLSSSGDEITVLILAQESVTWAGLVRLENPGAGFVPIRWDWTGGWLRVYPEASPPGLYVLTAVAGQEAFSLLVALHRTPVRDVLVVQQTGSDW